MSGHVPPIFMASSAPPSELAAWGAALPGARAVLAIGPRWKSPSLTRGAATGVSAELAYELHALLPVVREPERAIDLALAAALRALFGEVGMPVVELSLVLGASPRALFAIGRKIGALASRGVLLAGMGSWTPANDTWIANTLADAEIEELLDWRNTAPSPEPMELDALFVIAGAASLHDHAVGFPVRGVSADGESQRCVQWR